jgi:hypothetical protein
MTTTTNGDCLMRTSGMSEAQQIAAGVFYTDAELAAKPWLRRRAQSDTCGRRDPNTVPMTAARRAELDALVCVCAYCWEPGDERSALGIDGMHDECREVLDTQRPS